MIVFENIQTIAGQRINLEVPGEHRTIPASHLTILPAVIDPHVHFRTPGMEYKEDWRTGARAAIRGGCTQVFDMPNTLPPTITSALLKEKKALIEAQLKEVGIPLRYQLFFGADKNHFSEIPLVKNEVIGIKVFMGCSTGNLVIDDDESLHVIFSLAAQENMLVAVHAEDEHAIKENRGNFKGDLTYAAHSEIRNSEVATIAVAKAISLSRQYGTRLYILHVSTADEISLIKAAKQAGLPVFAETTPHHLFLNTDAYENLGGKALVNPPLRSPIHNQHLLKAIHEKIIDTIGSDHAPHTLTEKQKKYGECPSGMPGIEFMLPLLLNAHHAGWLSLDEIVSLTSGRAREIFRLPANEDKVLVDLNLVKTITTTESKCGWTPYAGRTLTGWPLYTILQNQCFTL